MTGTESINRVSTEAVKKATGKTWDEWLNILDDEGAKKMDHKHIVSLLAKKKYVTNAWWQQQVTVGYETARGLRKTGETADAGYEIGVQKTLPLPVQKAWELITSPEGLKIWLGNAPRLSLVMGHNFRTPDGTTGQIRVVREDRHIRLTWCPQDWKYATTLQVRLTPREDKTVIGFHHEKLAGGREREMMQRHWRYVLEQLEDLAEKS